MWVVFAVVFAAGVLISRMIKNGAKNGIEADAVVSRIVDDGTQTDIDINVYVRYRTADGEEIEAIISNPRSGLEEGQPDGSRYNPKMKTNARLV